MKNQFFVVIKIATARSASHEVVFRRVQMMSTERECRAAVRHSYKTEYRPFGYIETIEYAAVSYEYARDVLQVSDLK